MCPGTPFYETSVYHTWKRECQVLVTDDDDQEIIGNIDPFFREMHALGNLDKKIIGPINKDTTKLIL